MHGTTNCTPPTEIWSYRSFATSGDFPSYGDYDFDGTIPILLDREQPEFG
jgi:hypothetical protein